MIVEHPGVEVNVLNATLSMARHLKCFRKILSH